MQHRSRGGAGDENQAIEKPGDVGASTGQGQPCEGKRYGHPHYNTNHQQATTGIYIPCDHGSEGNRNNETEGNSIYQIGQCDTEGSQ